jgi:hypothetical protein
MIQPFRWINRNMLLNDHFIITSSQASETPAGLTGDSRKVIRLGLLGHLSFLAIALVWKFTIKRRSSNPYVSIVSPDKLLLQDLD